MKLYNVSLYYYGSLHIFWSKYLKYGKRADMENRLIMDIEINGQNLAIILYYFVFIAIAQGFNLTTSFPTTKGNIEMTPYGNPYINYAFSVYTEGCKIPKFHPLDKSVTEYVYYPNAKHCPNSRYPLLSNNRTHLWIVKSNLKYYNIVKEKYFHCCYKPFYPILLTFNKGAIKRRKSGIRYRNCFNINRAMPVKYEFVRAICRYRTNIVFDQFYVFTPKKAFTDQRLNPFETPQNHSAYNVIILGLSSTSRLNFHRTMPKTLRLLKSKGAVELQAYNKVTEGFSDLIPLLVGMNLRELRDTCWPNPHATFDRCPFIWERFKDVGHYTAFVENNNKLGTFGLNRLGISAFDYIPTDYYLWHFIKESESIVNESVPYCMGNKYYSQVLLDYVNSLTSTLNNYKLFGLFWESDLTSRDLNNLMLIDSDYMALIKSMESTGYLDNTILILLSDSGMSSGIISTSQGRSEERLPIASILLPNTFREKYAFAYENLKKNAQRLTTPYDLHSTLIDLIDMHAIKNDEVLARIKRGYANKRSMSLFLPVPANRTCQSAGVSERLCACLRNKRIPADSDAPRHAAIFLIQYLNQLLKGNEQCAMLHLEEILDAATLLNAFETPSEQQDFTLVVQTTPGRAVFQATLRRNETSPLGWQVTGPVSRLNRLGQQSSCVRDPRIKIYCFCDMML